MLSSEPPYADEVEVSLFGPGVGESAVIHLGSGSWMTIDSCIDRPTGEVPALAYLDRLGVDVQTAVKLVVATHAHDDHIRGISKIFERAESAFFVLPIAMTPEEFGRIVTVDKSANLGTLRRAHLEYEKVAQALSRRPPPVAGVKAFKFAGEGKTLLQSGDSWRVSALSPSDEAARRALQKIADALVVVAGASREYVPADPNELAAAIWIEAAGQQLLFGADLVNGPDGCGWPAVMASFDPPTPASLIKVPHHGSPNAHHDPVWERLLEDESLALIAPYRSGRRPLPDSEDIARIRRWTPHIYATAPTREAGHGTAESTRHAMQAVQSIGRHVRRASALSGHIRARRRPGQSAWTVETHAPALKH